MWNVDPDWLYRDLDPQNLMNTDQDQNPDPDPGQWNHQIDFKTSFKSKKEILKFLSLNLNFRD